ncbi:PREDICTED: uncharacterized protein LOC104585602 [Nelumbo nucifera]|uniref:Uncharacterized protein LOC104585602 n=1 Tax=Nelumbo nucifera TaxID=4432 RepID=A0A1U7YM19_NELNU|nr:PREDICTED: uncharacterized protein LOC104585602 [Nelumbo nucifera]
MVLCLRVKLKVTDSIRGSLADSYAVLPQYCTTLLASNLGSVLKLHAPLASKEYTYGVFKRVFICLVGPRDGFLNGCKKIIGLDEVESRDNWTWFLVELRDSLGIDDPHRSTFMSDRKKGIVEAVSCCMTSANHRGYLRYLYSNFKKLFKGKIGEARAMLIVEMLEDVRKRWMQKIYYRHKASGALKSDLLPKVQAIIDKRSREARSVRIFQSGQYVFQTLGGDLVENVTKIDLMSCTCNVWDISGLPCTHALAVLSFTRGRVEDLCDKAFHKATYEKVYSHFSHALLGQKYWQ